MADLSLAYRKTPAGAEELAAKALGLTRDQRNLLIVADGRLALSAYCKAVGCDPDKLASLAEGLLQLGLIEPLGAARPPTASAAATTPAASAPVDLVTLKQRVIDVASNVFGKDAKPVVQKLEAAHGTPGDLMAAVESAAKLAKLTIDERQSAAFLNESRRILGIF